MKVQCCVCKNIEEGDQWIAPALDALTGEPISHGYCPVCADDAFREIREYFHHNLPNAPGGRRAKGYSDAPETPGGKQIR